MPDITVPVPDDRVADFYQFFGQWLAGALLPTAPDSNTDQRPNDEAGRRKPWQADDLEQAAWLWGQLSARAKAMFTILMANPGEKVTGAQIAAGAGIPNGASGVAGVLAWPGRYSWQLSRHLPVESEWDVDRGASVYWMSPANAELFEKASTA